MSVLRNNAELAWAGASGNAIGETAAWIGVWTALTGGSFLAGIQLSNSPSALALGEVYYVAASGMAITQTAAANETETMAGRALEVGSMAQPTLPCIPAIPARTVPTRCPTCREFRLPPHNTLSPIRRGDLCCKSK